MKSMTTWNGKPVDAWHSAMDSNGNKVGKIFYSDGTIEYVRDPRLPWHADKHYKSMNGLYGSRKKEHY